MRYSYILIMATAVLLLPSCKKQNTEPVQPPFSPVKQVLLKDITIPNLPSPYYRFEYNSDSLITKADFSSGFSIYDVLYSGNRITEMGNNIFVNHDTLRYVYNNSGKPAMIEFINSENVVCRHVRFLYDGDQVKEIDWDHKEGGVGFLIDRTLTFDYYGGVHHQ